MRSVLNEASFFNDILKQYSDVATKAANSIASKKNSNYLGGSISKYTKNLVLSFPVLCDNTLSISTIQMISKATEKNIVSMLKMLLSAKSINGDDGREILSRIHMNIDADIEDIIDAIFFSLALLIIWAVSTDKLSSTRTGKLIVKFLAYLEIEPPR